MLRVFAVPLAVHIPAGRLLAGEPRRVIHRSCKGGWLTAMPPHLEPTD